MLAIICGSGFENPNFFKDEQEIKVENLFHSPIKIGTINIHKVIIMSRHGYNHEYLPHEVPYKDNLLALQSLGVTRIISISACGSLSEEIYPGTISLPNQFIDMTKNRSCSYNREHVEMAKPFDEKLRMEIERICCIENIQCSYDTTLVTIEGPRFSTRAESLLFKSWGINLINMTTVPEVCLANEIGIPYQVVNMVTDYDSWMIDRKPVSMEEINNVMKQNSSIVKKLIIKFVVLNNGL